MINCRGLFVPEPLISGFSDLGGPELDDCFTKRLVRLHQPQILTFVIASLGADDACGESFMLA